LFDAIKRKRLTARCTVCADVEVRFIAEALTTADGWFPENFTYQDLPRRLMLQPTSGCRLIRIGNRRV
jgi:hypothetical protein